MKYLVSAFLLFAWAGQALAADCRPYQKLLVGTAHRLFGLDAPITMFISQIKQESDCRPGVTAWDNGRGLAQFMDGTTDQVARLYPDLGTPEPYNPAWAIPAMLHYDAWINARVKGNTECDRWAATLNSYNRGLGYTQQAQKVSSAPGVWFGVTEHVTGRQSAKNFEYARMYPRWILFKHQQHFLDWGTPVCEGRG